MFYGLLSVSHCPEVGGTVLSLDGVKFELKDNYLVFEIWLVLVTPHICN
jgi:hypothetical protein